jgi:hypothetical protein
MIGFSGQHETCHGRKPLIIANFAASQASNCKVTRRLIGGER